MKIHRNVRAVAVIASVATCLSAYSGNAAAHACGTDTSVFHEIARYTVIPQQFPDNVSLLVVPGAAICPALPTAPGFVDFEDACKAHDACYETAGMSKGDCDSAFWDDLDSACDDHYDIFPLEEFFCEDWCYDVAGTMVAAVDEWGDPAYRQAQAKNWAWIVPAIL